MSDLIERLKKESRDLHEWAHLGNGGEPAELTANLIDEAITALSPVLPDDVAKVVSRCRRYEADTITGILQNDSADLLERQARDIRVQEVFATSQRKLVAVQAERIERLQAKIKELESALSVHSYAELQLKWWAKVSENAIQHERIEELETSSKDKSQLLASFRSQIKGLEAEATKWKEVAASRKGAVEAINGGLEFAAVLRKNEQLEAALAERNK